MARDSRSRRRRRQPEAEAEASAVPAADRIDRWLKQRLDTGDLCDVTWLDKQRGLFRIAWLHASSSACRRSRRPRLSESSSSSSSSVSSSCLSEAPLSAVYCDSGCDNGGNVFYAWECHRGRRGPADEHRRLKQTLRCALNGCRRHLRYRRDLGQRSGADAFRVYQFLAWPEASTAAPAADTAKASDAAASASASASTVAATSAAISASATLFDYNSVLEAWLADSPLLPASCDPYISALSPPGF